MCVGLLPAERVTRRARAAPGPSLVLYGATTGPRRDRRRERAREPGARRGGRGQATVRPDRRPLHGQEADRGVARARRARPRRVAPGLRRGRARIVARRDGARRRRRRRPPRPRPAARAGDGAVGDHDLGEPGADGRRRRAGAGSRGRGRDRALGARRGPRSASSPTRASSAPSTTASSRAQIAARLPDRRVPALRGRAAAADRLQRGRQPPDDARRRWVFEQYDQLVGSRTVRRPGFGAAVLRLDPSHRGLAVSLRAAAGELDPFRAGALAVLERPATSPAPAASRSRSPTASTSAIPSSPRSRGSSSRRSRGSPQAAEALGIPVVSGNVSLYNETDGRPIPPTPVVGCVGLVPDVRKCRAAGSGATRCTRSVGVTARPRARGDLIRFLVEIARRAPWFTTSRTATSSARSPRRERWNGVSADLAPSGTASAIVAGTEPATSTIPTRLVGVASDVRRLRHPRARTATSPAWRTSRCTPSSTAARRRPGSRSPRRAG